MSNARDALASLAALLAPGEPAVALQVLAAHDDPVGYVRAHADRLMDRGIDDPTSDLAWIALLDALTDVGRLAEVDWKEQGEDVARQLRALRSSPGDAAWTWLGSADMEASTETFLHIVAAGLRAGGTELVILDMGSDSYPLALVPAGQLAQVLGLSSVAGFPASVPG